MYSIDRMPRKETKQTREERLAIMRKCSSNWYHSKGKPFARLRYLIKRNNITAEELEGLETIDEKIEYARLVHIRNKYGIKIADIDDATTVCSESTQMCLV